MKKKRLTKPQRLWVKALEDGEYRQARGQLYRKGGFCCLGVACKLYNKEKNKVLKYRKDGDLENFPEVRDWLGLRNESGSFSAGIEGVDALDLVSLNDDGSSFKEIAKVIRANPNKVFK